MSLATATARTDSSRQELLHEQRRLAKLWDAFKRQEDEYRAIERERDDLWSRIQDLEKATAVLGDPTQTAVRLNTLQKENERFRADVADLGVRLEEYRAQFQDEQQRLAKLYKVYEDTDSQLESAQDELARWRDFWSKHANDLPPKAAQAAARAAGEKAPARPASAKAAKGSNGLTPAQRNQRKYAAKMRTIRSRAKAQKGGAGKIKNRTAATKLRRQLGLKA